MDVEIEAKWKLYEVVGQVSILLSKIFFKIFSFKYY